MCDSKRMRNFFSTLVPGSGRFQLTNLVGYSYVLQFGLWLWLELWLVSRLWLVLVRCKG